MNSRSATSWVLGVALLGACLMSFAGGCRSRGCQGGAGADQTNGAADPAAGQVEPQKLGIEDLQIGSGTTAIADKLVTVHYTGWLKKAKFDTSLDRSPLEFRLGKGEVLRGWDQGIPGMKVGGKRRLTVPSDLGYGSKGSLGGAIPPNSVLVFEIELVNVKD